MVKAKTIKMISCQVIKNLHQFCNLLARFLSIMYDLNLQCIKAKSHNKIDRVNGENIIYNLRVNMCFIQMDKAKKNQNIQLLYFIFKFLSLH